MAPGAAIEFSATGRLSDGSLVPVDAEFTATGGSVSPSGRYTAGTVPGSYLVVAKVSKGSLSDQASVTIVSGTSAAATVDRIELQNAMVATQVDGKPVDPATETVVLVDAHDPAGASGPTPCVDDLIRRTNLSFANLKLAAGTCSSPDEIVVFSVGDPVVLDQGGGPGVIWTNASGEVRTEDLSGGLREVKVALWITKEKTPTNELVETAANDDFRVANTRYDLNRAGIKFTVVEISRVWGTPTAGAIGQYCNAALVPNVRSGKVNVYYVPSLTTMDRGVHCRDLDGDNTLDPEDWNAIYISIADAAETTLAHELGHALGLEHTGDDPGWGAWYGPTDFTQDNLMWSGLPARTSFSLGQAFRINLEELSALNRLGFRTGATRKCECRFWDKSCHTDRTQNFLIFVQESNQDGVCPRISRGW